MAKVAARFRLRALCYLRAEAREMGARKSRVGSMVRLDLKLAPVETEMKDA
jgi:hypothetical protein